MADKDYSPLSASCVRALNDKLYEKRKVAALEIERMVKEYLATNNTIMIKRLLTVLGKDFAESQNPNGRKGGLIGLAAIAIALGKRNILDSTVYVNELVNPVLKCFKDSDGRVRYYGCEALYNIVKVARSAVLPFFNKIFDGLSKLAADPDQNVRSGAELLDRLLKDIVTESCSFDLVSFIPLLRERIYTKNPFAKQFIVSWVKTLDVVPDIDMLVFLPEILDGLFNILGDPNPEIRKMCEATLGEFVNNFSKTPGRVNYSAMVNILIAHSKSTDDVIQYTAIVWLKEFIQLSGRKMIPFTAGIISAVLPCYSYDDEFRRNTKEVARSVNSSLTRLITAEDDKDIAPSVAQPGETMKENLTDEKVNFSKDGDVRLDIEAVSNVLMSHMCHSHMQTRIAALKWLYHLHLTTPYRIFKHVEEFFPLLLKMLSDPSDEVVLLDLEVLAEISSSPAGQNQAEEAVATLDSIQLEQSTHGLNSYFTKFVVNLIDVFSTDRSLLDERGSFIIRQLCLLLNAEDIYRSCSQILLHEEDFRFAANMIQTLSVILLTSTELFDLRVQLKDLKTKESCSLFCCLYKSWSHNPVSTVALCLLTQNYEHACDLLNLFGDLEVTVEFLTEIDKLVQLIESPIFTYLRLQLLDTTNNQHLIKALYGLLMLLPQSDAFRTLRRRLDAIPSVQLIPPEKNASKNSLAKRPALKDVNFKDLREHFTTIQSKHKAAKKRLKTIGNSNGKT